MSALHKALLTAAGLGLALWALLLTGCGQEPSPREAIPPGDKLFTRLPSSYTGLAFENRLTDTEAFNVFTYRNYYNGGGVGIGDVNGDGLPDVYLTANQLPNKLYLNRGDFRFEDVTDRAGVAGVREWSTGVSFADVNGDGRLDLYVCNAGNVDGDDKANELYINQGNDADGIPRFEEQAVAYGVADEGYSTHAAFFDYDGDGDLDLYLLNNSFRDVSSFGLRNIRHVRHDRGGDKLYRNDLRSGSPDQSPGQARQAPPFTDVSEEAGIYGSEIAFGLGVTVGDVNRDGWMDIYVSNDFFERDYLYLNIGDGTFREALEEQMRYISLSSMGADMADVNNDGYPEIYVTDMLPENDRRLKTTSIFESWDVYQAKLKNDYHHQFMRNMLHLNNGDGTFSEIGQIAGVEATDWSWGALFADFDNDGHKDLFVSNGIYKDLTDQDFIDFFANEVSLHALSRDKTKRLNYMQMLERIPSTPIPNYAFRNRGDLTFTNEAAAWGLDAPSFSNGAAYGDLDNDGDLDLIVNNVNQELFVYRNEADTLLHHRYLKVRLEGEGTNRFGLGAKVTLASDGQTVYLEQMPMRGFQSTMDHVLTAGVGRADTVQTVTVEWPDGRVQAFTDVAANQTLTAHQAEATRPGQDTQPIGEPHQPLFTEVTATVPFAYTHQENSFVDFDRELLIPKMLSTEGPYAAVGDVNGDGREDVFIGGAKGQAGRLLLLQANGRFIPGDETIFEQDKTSEDLGAAFFDADDDGDLDLYVVSGGNEYSTKAPALVDRLYLNDGRGALEKSSGRLPSLYHSGSRVAASDFDGDGDLDLFVGGRLVPWRYGLDPESVILQNDGRGHFSDVTQDVAPELARAGMVTDAAWADVDGDGRTDLVVVGEWMPIRIFRNTGRGTLEPLAAPNGLERSHGWWNRIVADDFDGDGDVDFVAGNLGRNTRIRAVVDEPATLHVSDFDRNGSVEQIVSFYKDGTSYPMALRRELMRQLTYLKKKYPTHAAYAEQTVEDIFTPEQLDQAVVKQAYTFNTSYIENQGDGTFAVRALPYAAQLAPTYGILADDFDGDGYKDLLLAGNFHGVQPNIGRMDASYGLFLRGDGAGGFEPVAARESGFRVQEEARDIQYVHTTRGEKLILVTRNDAAPQLFKATL